MMINATTTFFMIGSNRIYFNSLCKVKKKKGKRKRRKEKEELRKMPESTKGKGKGKGEKVEEKLEISRMLSTEARQEKDDWKLSDTSFLLPSLILASPRNKTGSVFSELAPKLSEVEEGGSSTDNSRVTSGKIDTKVYNEFLREYAHQIGGPADSIAVALHAMSATKTARTSSVQEGLERPTLKRVKPVVDPNAKTLDDSVNKNCEQTAE